MLQLFSPTPRLLGLSLVLFGYDTPQQGSNSLDAAACADRLSKDSAQLVDVRSAAEYADGHIADALNLDWTNGQLEAAMSELDKSKPVLLYCASDHRSAAARKSMREQGFTDVVDLSGGIAAWREAGRPIEP